MGNNEVTKGSFLADAINNITLMYKVLAYILDNHGVFNLSEDQLSTIKNHILKLESSKNPEKDLNALKAEVESKINSQRGRNLKKDIVDYFITQQIYPNSGANYPRNPRAFTTYANFYVKSILDFMGHMNIMNLPEEQSIEFLKQSLKDHALYYLDNSLLPHIKEFLMKLPPESFFKEVLKVENAFSDVDKKWIKDIITQLDNNSKDTTSTTMSKDSLDIYKDHIVEHIIPKYIRTQVIDYLNNSELFTEDIKRLNAATKYLQRFYSGRDAILEKLNNMLWNSIRQICPPEWLPTQVTSEAHLADYIKDILMLDYNDNKLKIDSYLLSYNEYRSAVYAEKPKSYITTFETIAKDLAAKYASIAFNSNNVYKDLYAFLIEDNNYYGLNEYFRDSLNKIASKIEFIKVFGQDEETEIEDIDEEYEQNATPEPTWPPKEEWGANKVSIKADDFLKALKLIVSDIMDREDNPFAFLTGLQQKELKDKIYSLIDKHLPDIVKEIEIPESYNLEELPTITTAEDDAKEQEETKKDLEINAYFLLQADGNIFDVIKKDLIESDTSIDWENPDYQSALDDFFNELYEKAYEYYKVETETSGITGRPNIHLPEEVISEIKGWN